MASKKTPAKKPAAKPATKPAAKKPAAKPASKAKPAAKPASKPKPAAKPAAKKPTAPAAKKPAAKPAAKAPAKPAAAKGKPAKAASKPVAKTTKPAAKVAKAPAKPAKAPAKPAKGPVKAVSKPAAKSPTKAAAKTPAKPVAKAPAPAPAPAKPASKSQTQPAKSYSPVNSPTPVTPKKTTPTPELDAAEDIKIQPQKLTPFILKQKQRLLDLRDQLTDAFVGVTRDTLRNAPSGSEASGSGMHQGDAGSDAYDRDFALSMLAKEQDALYEIAQALRRVDKGVYGICEISGKKIPQARLEAIPFARLTVECQAEWEKEHGNRRFRPANEVGFGGGFYETDESETVSLDEDED